MFFRYLKTPLAALCLCVSLSAQAHVVLYGPDMSTEISGRAGRPQRLGEDDSYKAIKLIEWGEKGDKPCRIGLWRAHVNNLEVGQPYQLKCGGADIGYDKAIQAPTAGEYLSGISVCLNKDRSRLKGISIHTRKFDHKTDLVDFGGFSNVPGQPPFYSWSKTNCDNFERFVNCPEGHLAVALNVHWDGDRDIESITGLGLVCREVKRDHSGF